MPNEPAKVKKQVNSGQFQNRPENINKNGRPDKGWQWRDLFIKIAEEKKRNLRRKEVLAQAIWEKAEEGDIKAFDSIANRMEGKPPQPLGTMNDGEYKEQKIQVEFVNKK